MTTDTSMTVEANYADERNLVQALRRGDDAAFEFVVRTYSPRLLPVARRLLKNETDAEDALQDAFLSAFRGLEAFGEGARFSTWLHRIVVNAALMKLRRQRRKPECSIDELLPRFDSEGHHAMPVAAGDAPAESSLARAELHALVRARIADLPEDYRNVLVLRDIEELDTEETSVVLGISVAAVKTRLHRARQALRTLLEPSFGAAAPGGGAEAEPSPRHRRLVATFV